MFASGELVHQPEIIASSLVASRSPFGASRANGCFPERSQRAPFVQAHEPSGNGFHNGNTLHPYAAYLRAVDASADAGGAAWGITRLCARSSVGLRRGNPFGGRLAYRTGESHVKSHVDNRTRVHVTV